jgi:hypothetical protein
LPYWLRIASIKPSISLDPPCIEDIWHLGEEGGTHPPFLIAHPDEQTRASGTPPVDLGGCGLPGSAQAVGFRVV